MYYDALTLAAMTDEIMARCWGGRVQRIVQPSGLSLGLEIYVGRRHELLLNAEAQTAGVLFSEIKLRRGTEISSPLLLLLNKYVRSAHLARVHQPTLERVLRLTFNGEYGPVDLVCEIMGRYSNLILVAPDNLVMDAIKRVPPALNRYRSILPKQPYIAPPAQDKENPLGISPARLRDLLEGQRDALLWRRLVETCGGISPLLAREVIYRAVGEVEPRRALSQDDYGQIVRVLDDLLQLPRTHAWSPCIAFERDEEGRRPLAYAPYELTHLPDREPAPQISAAIRAVLEARSAVDAYQQVRQRLRGLVAEGLVRQQARLAALQRTLVPASEIEALRVRAELILAQAWRISPGQKELLVEPEQLGDTAEGWPAQPWPIALDPSLSAAENAQKLFREYRKRQAAAEEVPPLIEQTQMEIAYLEQLAGEIAWAQDRAQLDEVENELREAGYVSGDKPKSKPRGPNAPLNVRAADDTLILVGRNSVQNEEVTFRRGAPDDLWLHAHGLPGAHVLIKAGGGVVAEETLLLAARLAATYSAGREERQVQVDFTARRYVRRLKGGRPGMVTYTHEHTLLVAPQAAGEDRGEG